MMTDSEAVFAASEFLHQLYGKEGPYTFVFRQEWAVEHPWAWAVRFDTQERIDSGDMTKAPLTRLLFVPQDGSPPNFVPTLFMDHETATFLETGQRPVR